MLPVEGALLPSLWQQHRPLHRLQAEATWTGCGNTISLKLAPQVEGQVATAVEQGAQAPGEVDVLSEEKARRQDWQRKGAHGHYPIG